MEVCLWHSFQLDLHSPRLVHRPSKISAHYVGSREIKSFFAIRLMPVVEFVRSHWNTGVMEYWVKR